MATSEGDIRRAVAVLLKQYGILNTTEVKELLHTVMPFDSDDLEISTSRSEPKVLQRIGNIISHQGDQKIKIYEGIYQIDKSTEPALWSILTGLKSNDTLGVITTDQSIKRKDLRAQFSPKKIDWQGLNGRRTELGRLGEEFIIRFETNRVLKFAEQDADKIIHLSEEQGDGAGYDIISINEDGSDRYIEVKTTKGSLDTPFYMSENEKTFFEIHKNEGDLFIYRVYNFDEVTKTGKVEIISADRLLEDYKFDPISYKVIRK
ncbi:DUF3883 domain-containing protein [Streptococcus suis]